MLEGFDVAATFDDDYLYFYAERINAANSDREAAVAWSVGLIEPGNVVLDLACGHGRIANRLAARGAIVSGVDVTDLFLEIARADAAQLGVKVDYQHCDIRQLPWTAHFDVVLSWFTAFGYFDDETNKAILRDVARSLRRGGRFLVELNHRDGLMAQYVPSLVTRRDGNVLIDEHRFDPYTGRAHTRRTSIRDKRVRSFDFFARLFSFTELRSWLLDAGFATVEGFDRDGGPLTAASPRMLVRATTPLG